MKNHLEIRALKTDEKSINFDFFIDRKPLSECLHIDRFDLAYCDFDLDIHQVDKDKLPNYNRKKINKDAVSCFLGHTKPMNQFGTDRIVIYRCHCGSDYCGVVSFTLRIEDELIIWENISYENELEYEEGQINLGIEPIKKLKFDRVMYELEFKEYLKKYCA